MKIICPHCFHGLDVPESAIRGGGALPCPKCAGFIPLKSDTIDKEPPPEVSEGKKPLGPPLSSSSSSSTLLSPHEQMMFEPSEDILSSSSPISLGDMSELFDDKRGVKGPAPPPQREAEDFSGAEFTPKPESSPQQKRKAFSSEVKKPTTPAFGAAQPPQRPSTGGAFRPPPVPTLELDTEIPIQKPKPLPPTPVATPANVPSGYKAGSFGTGSVGIGEDSPKKGKKVSTGSLAIGLIVVVAVGFILGFALLKGTSRVKTVPDMPSEEDIAAELELPEMLKLPERENEHVAVKKGREARRVERGASQQQSKTASPATPQASVEDMHKNARALIRKKQYEEAASLYRTIIARNPQDAQAYKGLGRISERSGQMKQAVKHYEQYLRLNPNARDADKIRKFLDDYYD